MLIAAVVLGAFAPRAPALAAAPEDEEAGFLFAVAQAYRFEGSYSEALDAFKRAIAAVPDEPYLRLEFAEFLFQLGRLDDALEHGEAARRAAPESTEALRLLGRIHLRLAERSRASLESARLAFEDLRRLDPADVEVRVTLGRLYLSRSQSALAAEALREARSLRPDDRLISSLFVDALAGLGDDPQTLGDLEEMVRDDSDFLQPRLALARALTRKGDLDAVVDVLEEAPEEVRNNVEYQRQLAFAYYRTGRLEESLAVSEKWLDSRPQDTMGRYLRSLTLAALGRDAESEEALASLLEENPDSREFALALAEIMERQGRADEAAALLGDLLARLQGEHEPQESRRVLTMLVDLRVRAGQWQEILDLLDSDAARELAPDDPVHLLRSRALEELGRNEEALAALEAISGASGLKNRVAARRVKILYSLHREVEAEEELHRLTESGDVEPLMLAAEVLHEVEQYSRAVTILQQAAGIEPDNLEVLFWLGASHERDGHIEDAENQFRRLLDLDGDFAPALNYLGYMFAEQGRNLDEALALVLRAVALEPENGAYLDSLGWAYYRSGRLDEARAHLEKAARLAANDAVVFEHLGDLYRDSGDPDRAAEAYRRAAELGGDNASDVRRKLSELGEQ